MSPSSRFYLIIILSGAFIQEFATFLFQFSSLRVGIRSSCFLQCVILYIKTLLWGVCGLILNVLAKNIVWKKKFFLQDRNLNFSRTLNGYGNSMDQKIWRVQKQNSIDSCSRLDFVHDRKEENHCKTTKTHVIMHSFSFFLIFRVFPRKNFFIIHYCFYNFFSESLIIIIVQMIQYFSYKFQALESNML